MLSSFIFNFFASLIVVSVSGSIALHDTRLDKAFMSVVSPASETTLREFGHSVMSEQHVHSSHQAISNANATDPGVTNRSHKKHIALPYERLRLAALTA